MAVYSESLSSYRMIGRDLTRSCRTLFCFQSRRSDHKAHRHVPNRSI